jgi:hypothetical protein
MNRSSLLISIFLVAIAAASCSASSKKLDLGGGCIQNSDCNNPLSCKFASCHQQCVQSRDCPIGQQCVAADDGMGVCQTLVEAACGASTTSCILPLVCVNSTCVNVCTPAGTCALPHQTCIGGVVCVDNTAVASDAGAGFNLGGQCVQNSDCKNPLACKFATCHQQCAQSRDCPTGQQCVAAADGFGVCQTLVEAACGANGIACPLPLVCVSNACVNTCADIGTCALPYQTCIGGAVCVDNTALAGNPGYDGAAGADGGADAPTTGIDAPASGVDASGVDAIATGGGGSTGSKVDGSPPTAGASGNSCATGQTPSNFGLVATGDSDPNYTSGVGVLTATEFLVFNAYSGPASTDAGAGANVNRIDVQHFDPITRASKTKSTPLLMAPGDSGIYINGAALAPTGEIAIIYSAHTVGGWGVYLAFLDKNLGLTQTTLFVAVGSDPHQHQSYVQWLNGQFVASSTFYTGNITMKLGKFGADGSNPQITRVIPTDDPSGYVMGYNPPEGEVAFSGGTFAIAYFSLATYLPALTFVDASDPFSAEVASPVTLPSADKSGGNGLFAVAGTSQGFVTVYNGTSSLNAPSLLATFVSNSASGDAGVPVGATHSFLGGPGYVGYWSADGRSDGTGAGFAVLYPDGSVSFLYFNPDGSTHSSPQIAMEQPNLASVGDEVKITNFGGAFAVSLYSSAEHLTRMVASICK